MNFIVKILSFKKKFKGHEKKDPNAGISESLRRAEIELDKIIQEEKGLAKTEQKRKV